MFRLGEPADGEFGLSEGFMVDRAFGPAEGAGSDDAPGGGVRIASVADLSWPGQAPAPHNLADALAAAALARSYGAPPEAIGAGLRAFRPEPHRIALVGTVDGVDYVDDSKATNPHAAAASLAAYPSVVWVAGGMLRGEAADIDELVAAAAGRLRAAVLLAPAAQSFDIFRDYPARGDAFAAAVRAMAAAR